MKEKRASCLSSSFNFSKCIYKSLTHVCIYYDQSFSLMKLALIHRWNLNQCHALFKLEKIIEGWDQNSKEQFRLCLGFIFSSLHLKTPCSPLIPLLLSTCSKESICRVRMLTEDLHFSKPPPILLIRCSHHNHKTLSVLNLFTFYEKYVRNIWKVCK